jgi:hypothetical protein
MPSTSTSRTWLDLRKRSLKNMHHLVSPQVGKLLTWGDTSMQMSEEPSCSQQVGPKWARRRSSNSSAEGVGQLILPAGPTSACT